MQFAYFIGCLILAIVWFLIYFYRKDLRKEIMFGSLLGAPFGLSEFLYIPEYWNPPSILDLIEKIGFGVESIMFGFFTAGIAAVIFEFLEKRKTIKIKSDHRKHILPYLILVFAYLFLEFVFPFYTIYNLIFSLLLASLIIALIRKDLIKQIIFSGIFFSVVYLLLFLLFNKIFPSYIEKVYSLENFLGADLLGVPLEEVLFAFAVGACWSTLYEFIKGYKTVKLKK